METINPKVGAFVRAAKEDPERFWAQAAATLPWHRHWDHVLEWDPEHPDERGRYFRWFVGGETNLAYTPSTVMSRPATAAGPPWYARTNAAAALC